MAWAMPILLVEYVVYDPGFELLIGCGLIRPQLQVDGRLEFYDRGHCPGLHLLGWLFDAVRPAILIVHVYDTVVKRMASASPRQNSGNPPNSAHTSLTRWTRILARLV
jgi:hypothetical protein